MVEGTLNLMSFSSVLALKNPRHSPSGPGSKQILLAHFLRQVKKKHFKAKLWNWGP